MAKAKLMNVDDNDEASHHSHDDSQSTFASKNKQPTKSFFDELIQDCMASTSTFNDTESLIDEYLSTPCLLQAESTKEKAKETFKYPHQLLPQKTSNQQRAFLMS